MRGSGTPGPEHGLVPNAAGLTPFKPVREPLRGRFCGQGLHEHCLRPRCGCACHTLESARYRIPDPDSELVRYLHDQRRRWRRAYGETSPPEEDR